VREIRIRYGNGTYYNLSPKRFKSQYSLRRKARLRAEGEALVLDLPGPAQAWVPHRMAADQPRAKPSPPGYTGAFAAYRDQPGLAPEAAGEPGYPDFPNYPQQAVPQARPEAQQAPAAHAVSWAPPRRRVTGGGDATRTRRD
jgi:hypothetical protein